MAPRISASATTPTQDAGDWTVFTATYRIGNGTGATWEPDSLTNYAAGVLADSVINFCTNPLPASGGIIRKRTRKSPPRSASIFNPGARGHHAGLCKRHRTESTNRRCRSQPALDCSLHRLHHAEAAGQCEPQQSFTPQSDAFCKYLSFAGRTFLLSHRNMCRSTSRSPSAWTPTTSSATYSRLTADARQRHAAQWPTALFAPQNLNWTNCLPHPIYAAARAVSQASDVTATVLSPRDRTPTFSATKFYSMSAFQVARMDNDPTCPTTERLPANDERGK